MSTTTTESPDFASLPFSMGKSPSSLYMPPSTSAYGRSIGSTVNGACGFAANSEFTNLTPMMTSNPYGGPAGPASANGDSSNPSSASSSRTRLVNLGHDDSGLSGFSSTDGSGLMGYGSPQMDMKLDEDLEAMPRDRCNTWPMRRPNLDINGQTSPMIHDRIPEEDIYDSGENLSHSTMTNRSPNALNSPQSNSFNAEFGHNLSLSPGSPQDGSGSPEVNGSTKNKTTRRNAWGNLSYADLITQAILSSPEKRLTLSQVYEWMVTNVTYFRDKGDSNSSAGWKNSIRHNLSLHNRFMRIQNEGAGKSSWWVINPDAKPGRNPRRRAATMEGATKASLDKTRRKPRTKRSDIGIPIHSANSSAIGSTASIMSNNHVYNDQDDALNANFDNFRPRTQSNISVPGTNHRISPSTDRFDEFDFPPCWADGNQRSSNPEMTDLMGRTDQMRLNSDASDYRNCALKNTNPMVNGLNGMPKMEIKSEMPSQNHSIPPPPYTASQPMPSMANQMMRGGPTFGAPQQQHIPNQGMQPMRMQNFSMSNGFYPPPMYMSNGMNGMPPQQPPPHWQQQQQQQAPMQYGNMGMPPTGRQHHGQSLFDSHGSNGALPVDLENLNLPDGSIMEMDLDVEAVLRHELAQNHDGTINFEL